MIELAHPWILLLLPAPLIAWRFLAPRREQVSATRIPFFQALMDALGLAPESGAVILRRNTFQTLAFVLTWCLTVAGLSWPERVGEPIEYEYATRDIVLAIDLSGSMNARDFRDDDGNPMQRLDAVKGVVSEFIDTREGDRIALIVFGAAPYVQTPFTEDLQTVREMLNETQVGMAGPHTMIGDAIGLAIRTFEASEIEDRLLILLTDGADTGSRMSPVNAAEIAARRGVDIFTIGVGDPDGSGENWVDFATLESIAERANGDFFFAADRDALAQIYTRIDEQTPRVTEQISFRPRQSLAHWLFGAALIVALLTLVWLETRQAWRERHG